MKKNQKSLKLRSLPIFVIILAMGFGIGYTSKELEKSPFVSYSSENSISVCFTPNKKCQLQIINELSSAKKSIFVQAYSFTDKDIAKALVDASQRGVMVKVLLDKSNRKDNRSAKGILMEHHIPVRFDAPPGIAHNKLIILDKTTTIGGSYNYSSAAYKSNTENLLIIRDSNLAQDYIQNWQARWNLSKEAEIS